MTNQPVQQQGVCLVDHGGRECTCPGFNGNPPTGSSQPVQPAWEENKEVLRIVLKANKMSAVIRQIYLEQAIAKLLKSTPYQLLDEVEKHTGEKDDGSGTKIVHTGLIRTISSFRTKYELDK